MTHLWHCAKQFLPPTPFTPCLSFHPSCLYIFLCVHTSGLSEAKTVLVLYSSDQTPSHQNSVPQFKLYYLIKDIRILKIITSKSLSNLYPRLPLRHKYHSQKFTQRHKHTSEQKAMM